MSRWGGRKIRDLRPLVIDTWGITCVHCKGDIDLTRQWPDPLAFSIDHVLPRSRGGGDGVENLRPSHLHCNCSRGARVDWRSRPARRGRLF